MAKDYGVTLPEPAFGKATAASAAPETVGATDAGPGAPPVRGAHVLSLTADGGHR